ncbi:hypothetical protein HDU67_003080 [Dinochytrium kinnereticum]|nr:hypothetical protein HDU67_003080 [Dinochytrium kinnereticum]
MPTDVANGYHRCSLEDCERSLHACMFPSCSNWACVDSYGAVDPEEAMLVKTLQAQGTVLSKTTNPAKPQRVERSDWLCLMHGGGVADFTKSHWRSLDSLESYRSIHASPISDFSDIVRGIVIGTVTTLAVGAGRMTSTSSVASAAAVAVVSFVEDGLKKLIETFWASFSSGNREDCFKGVGRPRFGAAACGANGLPLGTSASSVVAYGIYKAMPAFRERGFVLEQPGNADLPLVLTIDGFFHTGSHSKNWSGIVTKLFPNHTWLSLQWDASPSWGAEVAAQWITLSSSDLCNIGIASTAAIVAAYREARQNCLLTSFLVADAISRLKSHHKVILLGHSLGATMILSTLKLIGESNAVLDRAESIKSPNTDPSHLGVRPGVHMAFLLGCASSAKKEGSDWDIASRAVEHRIFNLYSPHDHVLQTLGLVSRNGGRAGNEPVWSRSAKLVNHECSEVTGHGLWKEALDLEKFAVVMASQRP